MASALDDAGLAAEMARLADALRSRRPELDRAGMAGGVQMSGEEPLGLGDATTALAELADLAELEDGARPGLPGCEPGRHRRRGGPAGLRAAGGRRRRGPAPDRARARAAGLPGAQRRAPRPHPQGRAQARRHGAAPDLRRPELRQPVRRPRPAGRRPGGRAHRHHARLGVRRRAAARDVAGHGRERAGCARRPGPRAPGRGSGARGEAGPGPPRERGGLGGVVPPGQYSSLGDFEVAETERRTAAVVSLLVDLSYSMQLRGTWAAAKQTALALHALLRSKYPQDAVQVVGFLQLRARAARDRTRRARLGHGAGHQPAPRAAAGRPPHRQASRSTSPWS